MFNDILKRIVEGTGGGIGWSPCRRRGLPVPGRRPPRLVRGQERPAALRRPASLWLHLHRRTPHSNPQGGRISTHPRAPFLERDAGRAPRHRPLVQRASTSFCTSGRDASRAPRVLSPARDGPRFEPRPRYPRAGKVGARVPSEIRGVRGVSLHLVVDYLEGKKHLPIVSLRAA